MTWLIFPFLGALLHGMTNFIDKYLIERYFNHDGENAIGSLILFSAFFAVVALPVIYFIEPAVLTLPLANVLMLLVNGIIGTVVIILYLYALNEDETSTIMTLTQTTPVFAYILGVIFLNELLTGRQIFAALLIITGAVLLSINWNERKIQISKKAFWFLISYAILYASTGILFKSAALGENFWISTFWNFVGLLLVGIVLFAAVKSYRRSFIKMLKTSGKNLLFVNSINETLNLAGNVLFMFSYLLVPVALVFVAESIQPAMVLIMGIILTIFFPKIIKEDIRKKTLLKKSFAIALIVVGIYFLQ